MIFSGLAAYLMRQGGAKGFAALIAAVLRNSHKGCYVRGAIGVPIEDTLNVNGVPFDFNAYPHPHRDE